MSGAAQYQAAKVRLDELGDQVQARHAAFDSGDISRKQFAAFMDSAESEANQCQQVIKSYERASRFGAASDAALDPSGTAPQTKGMGVRPQSVFDLDEAQIKGLYHAAKNGLRGFSVEVGSKSLEGFMAGVETKATSPVAESGLNLPAVIAPARAMGLPYEPTRLSGYLPGAMMTGPSAAYLVHSGNTNEASGVDELGSKPDLAPTVTETIIKPQKIAGLVSVSWEAGMDYPDFNAWLPLELQRSLINAESNYLLNAGATGGPSGAAFTGILAASGTLTRAVDTTNSEKPLDTLSKAFVDLRTGSAYAEPDLIVMSPATWGALRREKDSSGRYLLDLLAGPAGLSWNGAQAAALTQTAEKFGVPDQTRTGPNGGIWGVPVVETTQIADGKAVVMSVRAGAAVFWVRAALRVEFNPWGDSQWTKNFHSWRVEERISLSIPRPAAINVVSGLPDGS